MADLSYLDAVILGVVEGLTEYLPVSSTGHLTITEKLLGLEVDDPAVTAYTAVIQLGAIAGDAALLLPRHRPLRGGVVPGPGHAEARKDPDYGLALGRRRRLDPGRHRRLPRQDLISGALRSLWVVAVALLALERRHGGRGAHLRALRGAREPAGEHSVRPIDGLVIGLVQCLSLIPGVSRSGATISAGIARGIDRVTATRLSFFLAIPALTAAGLFQAVQERTACRPRRRPVLVGIVVAFVVAYATIAWLLRFVASNTLLPFVWYRIALGLVLVGVLAAGVISAT